MHLCDWKPCGKETDTEEQEIHLIMRGDITFYACSPECESNIIDDIYRIISKQGKTEEVSDGRN